MDIFPGGKTLLNFKGRFPGMWGEASRWSCGLRALLGCCDSCDGLNGQLRCISCRFPNLTASLFHLFQCQFVAMATHSSYKLFTEWRARSLMASTLQSSSTSSASWLSSYASTIRPTSGESGKSWLEGNQKGQRAQPDEYEHSLLLVTWFQEGNVSGECVWGSHLAFKYPRWGRRKEWCKLRN